MLVLNRALLEQVRGHCGLFIIKRMRRHVTPSVSVGVLQRDVSEGVACPTIPVLELFGFRHHGPAATECPGGAGIGGREFQIPAHRPAVHMSTAEPRRHSALSALKSRLKLYLVGLSIEKT